MPIALPADADAAGRTADRPAALGHARARVARDRAAPHRVVRRAWRQLPAFPVGDALDDATVLIAGRGPLYPELSVAMGERVKMVGALSVEAAAKHLNARDIDGIVVGDGFSPRMVEAFLTVLAQDTRFRDIPVAVIGEETARFCRRAAQYRPCRRRSGAAGRAHGAAGAHACFRGAAEANAEVARRRRHVRSRDRAAHARRLLAGSRQGGGGSERGQHGAVGRAAVLRRPLDRARRHGGRAGC